MNIFRNFISFILVLSCAVSATGNGIKKEAPNILYENKKQIQITAPEFNHSVKAAYLMEAETGTMLYAKNPDSTAEIASVTKIMSLLLVMEALENGKYKLDDTVFVSKNAASMGGSQVYLEEGERITVEELIKCAVIASANDATVALAELTAGSEDTFVKRMNEKANELKLKNTYFENTTGLDDTTVNHHSCAYDVAVMSRQLIKYDLILKYSSIWQDSIRNGEMGLTNTNRLIRYYEGCNGLKTGSTDKAGFCISTTAKRDNMQLIAVILGADTKDERNTAARDLLDYGFSNFALFESKEGYLENAAVYGGIKDSCQLYSKRFVCLIEKEKLSHIEKKYEIPEHLKAPVLKESIVGKITYSVGDAEIGYSEIYSADEIEEISIFDVILRILSKIVVGK